MTERQQLVHPQRVPWRLKDGVSSEADLLNWYTVFASPTIFNANSLSARRTFARKVITAVVIDIQSKGIAVEYCVDPALWTVRDKTPYAYLAWTSMQPMTTGQNFVAFCERVRARMGHEFVMTHLKNASQTFDTF